MASDEETAPPPDFVELRIHGVGGTSPETLLGVPYVELVGGDKTAGFFRPPAWITLEGPKRTLEGYSWGGLTSRSRARALWLLLLPFALVNMAGWMFRNGGTADQTTIRNRTSTENVAMGLIRLYGMIITVTAWVFASVIVVDLMAYQCGLREGCVRGRWFLWPWDHPWVVARPARGIGVAAGLLFLSVLVLAYVVRRSQKYVHPDRSFRATDDPAWRLSLRKGELWRSPHVAHRLGLTHTAAAVATVGVTAARVVESTSTSSAAPWFATGFLILLVVAGLMTLRLERVPQGVHASLLIIVVALMVVFEIWLMTGVSITPLLGQAPGARSLAQWSYIVGGAVAVILVAVHFSVWRREGAAEKRDWTLFVVPVAILISAGGPINAIGSGILIRMADLLGDALPFSASKSAESIGNESTIIYADTVGGTAVFTVVMLIVFAALLFVAWRKALNAAPTFEELQERYAGAGGLDNANQEDMSWAAGVGRAEAIAGLTDQTAFVVASAGLIGGGLFIITAVAGGFSASNAGLLILPSLHQPASYVVGLLPIVAIWFINRVYSSDGLRRVVGIVWDVATFWPRWFHPWAPPSYGERAVPQLRNRLMHLAESNSVILSAHSQGTAIAVATLASMLDEPEASGATLRRTTVLTHGSPIRRLYARYFPEYFDQSLFAAIREHLGPGPTTWFNLRRRTDYIGGSVFDPIPDGASDELVLDPETPLPPAQGEPRPSVRAHSNFYAQTEYGKIVENVVRIPESGPSR